MHSSVEISLHYGGILLRRRQGFDYIGGNSVMICGVNTYEFFYNQLLSWVVENVNCPNVGVVCYRVPGRSICESFGISIIEEDNDFEWLYRHSIIGDVVDIYLLHLIRKTAFWVDCGKSDEMDSRSSKVNVESPKCFLPLYTMPSAEENPMGSLDMDSYDNEVDMFISNQNRKLMYLKLKDNVSIFASETKPECSKVDIVTDNEDMNPIGDISNKRSVIESYGIENKSEHEMADTDSQFDSIADDVYTTFFEKAEPERVEPEKAEPEKAELEIAEPEKPEVIVIGSSSSELECSSALELKCSSTSESSSSDDSSS
ncbi:hypothetical protein Tco_0398087 [Tanacetum coccineum]